jgi:CubicO group peptidase (beta-lactamase class C family)
MHEQRGSATSAATCRRGSAFLAAATLLLAAVTPAAAQPWPASTLAEQRMATAPIDNLVARVGVGEFGNVDRLVIVRNGFLLVDERLDNDYRAISRGRSSPIGCGIDACTDARELNQYNYLHPDWHPWWQGRDVHTLQSVTKSVSATLIGIALARDEIATLDAPLLSFFDGYDLSTIDARLRAATLRDMLTMRTGIEWHEQDRPLDETNTTLQLERSADWIRFTLAQPMDTVPGARWRYSSGDSQLMSQVIRRATGRHVDVYAEQHLFGPLGISDYQWKKTPTGHPDTEGGLYLEARDLARIGQLYLDDGIWRGQRILPAGWAREATTAHVASPGYGYQWWISRESDVDVWSGRGFGGQFLVVIPALRIVAVVNSWNVFGDRVAGIRGPFIEALVAAAAGGAGLEG